MHKNYPSHVTKEQFENIKSILENSKKKTKPRSLDLYEVFCFNYVEKYGWPKIIHQFTLKILFLIKNLLKVTLFSVKIL
ncbi:hypothetical protein [Spiroplasma endosymbiont of Amphimallon solstitiale]|uniref:hypothetical protein n=1 Tax=Spiroplasma endosymbiont of Amphimallon solstitiale TaxID=3066288 RepID=UPI00313E8A7C